MPKEAAAIGYIEKFGVQGVYGRPLGYWEIQHMLIVDNIINAYRSREQSDNWADWANKHKIENKILNEAMKLAGAENG